KYKAVQNQFGWNSTGGVIQFTTPDGSDPRNSNSVYEASVESSTKYYLQESLIWVMILSLVPLVSWLYLKSMASNFWKKLDDRISNAKIIRQVKYAKRFYAATKDPIFYFCFLIAAVFLYDLFVIDAIKFKVGTVPDSVTYSEFSPIRPIATVVFLKFLGLISTDISLVPIVQYSLVIFGLGLLSLITGMVVRNHWISVLTLLLFMSGFWVLHPNTLEIVQIDNHYIDLTGLVMSEPLFFFFSSVMLFFCVKLLINWSNKAVIYSVLIGVFLGLAMLTRNIAIAYFVIIPLFVIWVYFKSKGIYRSFLISFVIIIPVVVLQIFQFSVYRMVTHSDFNLNQGGGYHLLRQAIPATFLDSGAKLTKEEDLLNQDERYLLSCLLANNQQFIADYSAIKNPLIRFLYWDDISGYFMHGVAVGELGNIRCTQKILVQDYDFKKGWDERKFSLAHFVTGQEMNSTLAKKIIKNYPFQFFGLVFVQTLSAEVKVIS
ncbi:MAG: hypothetical protein ORN54_01880, partial [Cyclobacteriaceae bacterium]|nr:hypothetical protein [Cyclobacteriaceae bacterium]